MTLDDLIKLAHEHPNEVLVQFLSDQEVDGNGRFVGYAMASYYWQKVLHQANPQAA